MCDKLCEAIRSDKYDVIIINFANPDMVGHTGVLDAAVKAVEAVDECVGRAVEAIKEVDGDALACLRQVNDSDVLVLLELGDYRAIVKNTIDMIRQDFPRVSAVFSVNCLFRYLLFNENHYMQEYLMEMGKLGGHAGFVGYGEHYNNRFVNQSMTCVVFE